MSASASPSESALALAGLAPFLRRALGWSLAVGLLALVPMVYMFEVYDRVLTSRSHTTLWMLTWLVLMAVAVMDVLEWARTETLREAGATLDHALAPRVFAAMYGVYLRHTGTPGARPLADLRTVRDFFHAPALGAAMEVPVALLLLVALFVISPVLGWLSLAVAVVQTGLSWLHERSAHAVLQAANVAEMEARACADATLRDGEVVAALGMHTHMRSRWLAWHAGALGLQKQASDQAALFQSAGRFLQIALSSALLGLGAWLLLQDRLAGGPGMLIVGSLLGARMLAPLVQLVSQWRAVVQVRGAWVRLDALLRQSPAASAAMPLPRPMGRLGVEGLVAGASAGGPVVLKGVSFALQPGETLAVVGPSAAGKTTLARMLMGLWPPLAGTVRLDGADLSTWNKRELGPHLGFVPQEVELLEGTLGENIARFGAADRAALEDAVCAVGLHDWVAALPQGLATPVGPAGVVLSGGQRQRVALARAIYGSPALVVLDEPDASLDEEGHAALLQVLRGLRARGATCVVMTHLPSLLRVADKILVLENGTPRLLGPRDEVLAAIRNAHAGEHAVPVRVHAA